MIQRPYTPLGLGWVLAVVVLIFSVLAVLDVIAATLHFAYILILLLSAAMLL